jgi:hypothetical protein
VTPTSTLLGKTTFRSAKLDAPSSSGTSGGPASATFSTYAGLFFKHLGKQLKRCEKSFVVALKEISGC